MDFLCSAWTVVGKYIYKNWIDHPPIIQAVVMQVYVFETALKKCEKDD